MNTAHTSKRTDISPVWIVPLIALLVGGWMLYQYLSSRGPEITLILPDASGLHEGKTQIKAKNVQVGTITEIQLSEDYHHIIAKAQIDKEAKRMLKEDTQFWIVKPHVGADGISGLDTLLSGSYIEIKPGLADDHKYEFNVRDQRPITGPDSKGRRIVLAHKEANILDVGQPVLHHGLTVGRVEKTRFDSDNAMAYFTLFVFAPYDKLLYERSEFWVSSGVELEMSADGFDLRIGSLETMLTGGVSFDVPEGVDAGTRLDEEGREFRLYESYEAVLEHQFDDFLEYVLLFEDSVRGLKAGAPVEYRGIRIGTVERVPLHFQLDPQGKIDNQIPVLIRLEVERISQAFRETDKEEFAKRFQYQLSQGLRGTLKTGSLITGALYVDLNFYEDEPEYVASTFEGFEVIPVVGGSLSQIQKQLSDFLSKLNGLELEKTVASLNSTLANTSKLMSSAKNVTDDLDEILSQPSAKEIPGELNASLEQLKKTLQGLDENSELYHQLTRTLTKLERVLNEVSPAVRTFNEQPNSIIFGKDGQADPVPAKGN